MHVKEQGRREGFEQWPKTWTMKLRNSCRVVQKLTQSCRNNSGGGGGSSGGKTEENGDETTPEALTDSSIERRLQQLESMLEAEEEGAYEASSATPRAIKNAASEGIPSPSSDVVAESSDKEVAERLKRLDDLMVQDVPSPRIDATPQASKPAEVVAASSSASPMASPQVPSAGVDERLERLENLLRSAATPREQQTPVLAATSTPGGREPGRQRVWDAVCGGLQRVFSNDAIVVWQIVEKLPRWPSCARHGRTRIARESRRARGAVGCKSRGHQ